MDLLDKYKETWSKQPEEANKLSKVEIYKMAHSKSSSIVKWIFIIGLLEFAIMLSSFLFFENDYKSLKKMNLYWIYSIINTVGYIVVIYFVVKFYLNYKKISAIDNTKTLMNKILKTRKTVRNYVIINLGLVSVLIIAVIFSMINNELVDKTVSEKVIIILVTIVVGALTLVVIWLFYQLLYGILLKKLNRNYKELAKLDELN